MLNALGAESFYIILMTYDKMRQLVIQKMEEKGLNKRQLSIKLGRNEAYIDQYLNRGVPEFLPEDIRANVSEILGIEEDRLKPSGAYRGVGVRKSLLHPEGKGTNELAFGPDQVPILGYANASDEAILLNYDEPIGFALRHPSQKDVKNAYFLEIYDESMSPRYYPGELAAINGDKRPLPKRDCAIELVNGEAYIKQFVRMNEKELICNQLNPPKEWKRPRSQVKAIHAVGGRSDK